MNSRIRSINKRMRRLNKDNECGGKGIYMVDDKGDYKVINGVKMTNKEYKELTDKHKDCCLFVLLGYENKPYEAGGDQV